MNIIVPNFLGWAFFIATVFGWAFSFAFAVWYLWIMHKERLAKKMKKIPSVEHTENDKNAEFVFFK